MELYVLMRKNYETGEYEFSRGTSSIRVFTSEWKALATAKAHFGYNPETDKIVKFVQYDDSKS